MRKKLTKNFWWVGSLDPGLRVFDVVMKTGHGTSYNSFLLKGGGKNVLFETTKATFADEYIRNLAKLIPIKDIDILVLSHTEPDHTGAMEKLLEANPSIVVYATAGGLSLVDAGLCLVDFGFVRQQAVKKLAQKPPDKGKTCKDSHTISLSSSPSRLRRP